MLFYLIKFARHSKKSSQWFRKYELLDEKERKFQNQKETEFIDQWLRYVSPEKLLYVPKSKRAKKLLPEVVPETVDEYLTSVEKYLSQKEKDQILNPVWHVHNGKLPTEKIVMSFSRY